MAEGSLRELLRAEAVLLLQRERELFDLRRVRRRTEKWLGAFHALSLKLHVADAHELVATWAELMVGALGFERCAAVEIDRARARVASVHVDPGPAPASTTLPPDAAELLEAHPSGTCDASAPEAMRALGARLGFESFFWLFSAHVGPTGLLLVSGYSSRTAPFRELPEHDRSHFLMLGNHLVALLSSSRLVAEVDHERAQLAAANRELEEEMRERVRAERELQHAQKLDALGRMAAGLAHEVNNPLTAVVANLQLCVAEIEGLARSSWNDALPGLLGALGDASEGADRIARIMRDISTFATRKPDAVGAVDLREALDTALRLCANVVRHTARLSLRVEPVPRVVGERRGLEQVLVNLLTNASQALPPRPIDDNRIEVVVRREGAPEAEAFGPQRDRVVLEIRDNGVGIAPEHLARLFDPFFTTRAVGEGMGLGLSVCRGILESFGATVAVEGRRGEGTIARVTLRVAHEPRAAEPRTASAAGTAQRRVLVIDDEPAIVRVLEKTLGRRGVAVVGCTNGKQALALYREGAIDLVLCDLMMPEMNGMEVHAALDALGPAHVARLAFMSGGVFSGPMGEFLARTKVRLLDKPCQVEEILRLLEEQPTSPEPAPGSFGSR